MDLGKGCVYGAFTYQKYNTKRSTEAESIGVRDILPQVNSTRYF